MPETIHRYRENPNYKKLRELLSEYPQHFVDDLYLVHRTDIEKQDNFYDVIAENDSVPVASKALKLALADA